MQSMGMKNRVWVTKWADVLAGRVVPKVVKGSRGGRKRSNGVLVVEKVLLVGRVLVEENVGKGMMETVLVVVGRV